jgi:hypothetical protein
MLYVGALIAPPVATYEPREMPQMFLAIVLPSIPLNNPNEGQNLPKRENCVIHRNQEVDLLID